MNTPNAISTFHDPKHRWTIHQGDVQVVLPTLSSNLYDAVLCDPPYGLNFMGHGWDSTVPPAAIWKALLKLSKPGATLLAFGGPKTFHRLACSIEDGGWEMRDTISWLYGQGFPKGGNIGNAVKKATSDSSWEGYKTGLKPAWEPIIVAQKPRQGSFAKNAIRFGCGGLNIIGCQIGTTGGTKRSHQAEYPLDENGGEDRTNWARSGHTVEPINSGRFPSNVIIDEQVAAALDLQSGHTKSRRGVHRRANSHIGNGKTMNSFRSCYEGIGGYNDEGEASRFFYVAKASEKERKGNNHPTVKPLKLCEHLARLILPPKRTTPTRILVPFCGTGTEMLAALTAGWDHITGIERDGQYVQTARRRLTEYLRDTMSA
jgi:site-specific DNA-methyltransferase (adenine-specific)